MCGKTGKRNDAFLADVCFQTAKYLAARARARPFCRSTSHSQLRYKERRTAINASLTCRKKKIMLERIYRFRVTRKFAHARYIL